MPLSFCCPGCGKPYDLPASMAGKKARCKQCRREFVIPDPSGPATARSAEALPVAPRPVPSQPTPRADSTPRLPRPPADAYEPILPPTRSTPGPAGPPKPPRPRPEADAREPRPWWVVPAIAGGGVALLLAINVVLFFALVGGSGPVARVEADPSAAPPPVEAARARPAPAPVSATTVAAEVPGPGVAARPGPGAEAEPATGRPMTTAEIVSRYEPSVALIKGRKGMGTGFVARPNVVATNAHVIDGELVRNLEVRFPSADEGRRGPYPARLLYKDKARDLAILAVESDLPPIRVAEAYKFRKGEDVTVIGNPGVGGKLVLENAISRGIVSSMTRINDQVFMQLGIAINPGNSGGPVFDPLGRVIGVVTLKTTQQEGLAFAIPAEDLRTALDIARSRAGEATADDGTPAGAGGDVPELSYRWKEGRTYVYAFDLSLQGDAASATLRGGSIYRVKAVDKDGITLGHRGWVVTTRRDKDGKVPAGGVSGPKAGPEVELKVDEKGNLLAGAGGSPLPLLGDLAMLVIEPLPEEPQAAWDDSQAIALNEVEQVPGAGPRLGRPGLDGLARGPGSRLNPRSRIGSRAGRAAPAPPPQPRTQVKVTQHEATEETTYTLGPVDDGKATIRKSYELTTREKVGAEPRLRMTGEGTITFDVRAGIPLAMTFEVLVVEVTGQATARLPIKVSCRLLEGAEREKALRPPSQAPSAMNPIAAGELARALAALKAPDTGRRREACRSLFDSAPVDDRRAEVSRALERLLPERDMGLRSDAVKALGAWADPKAAALLVARLDDEPFGVRDELFEAVARAAPDERSAGALAAWLGRDPNRAARALRAIGPAAEGPLLRFVEEGADFRARSEACRVLKDVGTSASVDGLGRVAGRKSDGEVGRAADDALKSIARRYPGPDEWSALLRAARSPDGGRRREAADRLLKVEPAPGRRAEVARALEALAVDVDGGTQSLAIRALAVWGDAASRAILVDRLDDPDLRPAREAIEALGKLGPDASAARAIARRAGKERSALDVLASMGPIAEPSVHGLLRDARKDDAFLRNDLAALLGRIGTRASLPALREAAAAPNGGAARKALKDLEAWAEGGPSALLADLRSGDRSRRSQAVQRLAATPPGAGGADRPAVARALDALWDVDDVLLRRPLGAAVSLWGDDRSADALADRLARPDSPQWEEALTALVKLRPDARAAGLLAARLPRNPGLVVELARTMAAEAERPLLGLARGGTEPRARVDACRALASAGTPAAVPELKALAARAGDDQLARDAEDALKAIAARQ